MKKLLQILLLTFFLLHISYAIDFDQELTEEDKETFDEILIPVMKIYLFIKYISTAFAVLFLLIAGVIFMISGEDRKKRDDAKSMGKYVIIGLIVIRIAPFIVEYLVN